MCSVWYDSVFCKECKTAVIFNSFKFEIIINNISYYMLLLCSPVWCCQGRQNALFVSVCEIQTRFLLTCSYLAASFSNSIVSAIQENFKIWLFLVFEILIWVAKAAKAATVRLLRQRQSGGEHFEHLVEFARSMSQLTGNSEYRHWGTMRQAQSKRPRSRKAKTRQMAILHACTLQTLQKHVDIHRSLSSFVGLLLSFSHEYIMNAYNELLHHCTWLYLWAHKADCKSVLAGRTRLPVHRLWSVPAYWVILSISGGLAKRNCGFQWSLPTLTEFPNPARALLPSAQCLCRISCQFLRVGPQHMASSD